MRRVAESVEPTTLFRRWGAVAVSLVVAFGAQPGAHKAMLSPYTYNEDVRPIFRDHCGRCHADGGPAPMSLLTYKAAVPWAESIREELVDASMPPWFVDPAGPAVVGDHSMSARDIDIVVTWASGGMPEGRPSHESVQAASNPQWRTGPPDVKLQMGEEHEVPSTATEETFTFTLPTNIGEAKWIRSVDLLPGNPAIVRGAVISVDHGALLSMWWPDSDSVSPPRGTAFRLPPHASLHVAIHYKKPWQDERKVMFDRSTVGLYFADDSTPKREIAALTIEGQAADLGGSSVLVGHLAVSGSVVAIRPTLDRTYESVDVHGVTPSGDRVPLLLLSEPRPEWRRRYWLVHPVELPAGSKLEMVATSPNGEIEEPRRSERHSLEIAFDYVK